MKDAVMKGTGSGMDHSAVSSQGKTLTDEMPHRN